VDTALKIALAYHRARGNGSKTRLDTATVAERPTPSRFLLPGRTAARLRMADPQILLILVS
jgi:hypothetical protein